jgi:hypothetical protein
MKACIKEKTAAPAPEAKADSAPTASPIKK